MDWNINKPPGQMQVDRIEAYDKSNVALASAQTESW